MKIQVTEKDIRKGLRGRSCLCPVARAIATRLGAGDVAVNNEDVSFLFNGIFHNCMLPLSVVNFIADFDSGRDVSPFEFDLAVSEVDDAIQPGKQ